ncbi:MAG: discoidin domain-containing protein [Verrucomicrobia bacterium]|nr:discoidin domain-containing protein [Verrucomicrobiota bacterium]
MPRTILIALVMDLILAAGPAWGVTVEATRAQAPPAVDGRLDDPCWRQAKAITAFTLMNSAQPAQFPNSAYVVFDDNAIYIGVRCEEPNVADIKTRLMPHDSDDVYRTDCIEIMLDPTLGKNDYYHFAVNASGSVYDRACTQGGNIGDKKWDAEITAHAFIGDKFWSCEVAIPFYNLNLTPQVKSAWGVNICREKMNPSELSAIAEKGAFNIAASFAVLRGLDVDFSRYCYRVGSPVNTAWVKDGSLDVQLDASVLNETGQDRDALLECWLISPSGKTHVASASAVLPSGMEQSLRVGRFRLAEQGDYACFVRVSDPGVKQPLAVRRTSLHIEYVPMAIRLIEPWYRDAIFETQNIKEIILDVELRIRPEELKDALLEVQLCAKDSGQPLESKTVAKVNARNRVALDAVKLAPGKFDLLAVLKDQNGKTLADTSRVIQKLPYKKGEVWLGKDLQWRVDGAPFFINGAWNYGEDFIPGLNVFVNEKPGGIRLLAYRLMNEICYKIGKRMQEKTLKPEDLDLCRRVAREFKDNPGLFAYYLADEPECLNWSAGALEQAYQAVREEDPYHPMVISNDSMDGLKSYARCAEINGLHPYPVILKDKRINDLSAVVSFVEAAQKIFRDSPHKQTIAYLHQGFNYGDYGSVNNRVPNYPELRNQDLLALICGATGFIQFDREIAHYPELSIGLPHLTKELAYLGPIALAPKAIVQPVASSAAIKMLLKEWDGDLYLLACNASMQPHDATITLPGAGLPAPPRQAGKRAQRFQVISEDRDIKIARDAWTDHFDAFEAHIYSTAKKKPDLLAVKEICRRIDAANQKRKKPGNLVFQMFEGDGVILRASSNEAAKFRRPENGLWHLVDGVIDTGATDGIDPRTLLRWRDTTPKQFPDWVEIQWPSARSISKVIIYPFKKSLKDYAVQVFVGNDWKDVDKATGKNDDVIFHVFEPVTTDRVRLWITAANGPNSWISEVEVYEK